MPRERYDTRLPVCRVTRKMRDEVDRVARENNVTNCEVQRRAMELFLAMVSEKPESNSVKPES